MVNVPSPFFSSVANSLIHMHNYTLKNFQAVESLRLLDYTSEF